MNKLGFVLLLSIASITSASADSNFYLKASGGYNGASDYGHQSEWFSFGSETGSGYVLSGAIGTSVPEYKGLRLEAEVSYRHNELQPWIQWCEESPKIKFEGDDSTTSLMVNALYDIPVGDFPVKPFVMAGLGYSNREITAYPFGESIGASASGVSYSLGAGGQYALDDRNKISIEYRYLKAPTIERDFGELGSFQADGDNHSVMFGITRSFN